MIRKTILITIVLMVAVGSVYAATTGDVLVVYEGRTETNRHAIEFLEDYFRDNDADYRVRSRSVENTGNFTPNDYLAVVVLNTGQQAEVSAALATFADRWSASLPVVTVNLQSRRGNTSVESSGVDAVTAATGWEDRGLFGKTNDVYEMHATWAEFVLSTIKEQVGS